MTWSNQTQSINISTDILKEMLPNPSSPTTEAGLFFPVFYLFLSLFSCTFADAEMADEDAEKAKASTPSRPSQQVYSAPSRREKKEEEPAGPREGIIYFISIIFCILLIFF